MKRFLWIVLASVLLLVSLDRVQWFTGHVPLSNVFLRVREGAPEAKIHGHLLVYYGTHEIRRDDLQVVGATDSSIEYYRVKDWPAGMPGGWIYIPQTDEVSYRYADPTRFGVVR